MSNNEKTYIDEEIRSLASSIQSSKRNIYMYEKLIGEHEEKIAILRRLRSQCLVFEQAQAQSQLIEP